MGLIQYDLLYYLTMN